MLSIFHAYVRREKPSRWFWEGKAGTSAGSSGFVLTHRCYILGAAEDQIVVHISICMILGEALLRAIGTDARYRTYWEMVAPTQGIVPTWVLRCAAFQELGGRECLSGRGRCGCWPHSCSGVVAWRGRRRCQLEARHLDALAGGPAPDGFSDCIDKKQQAVEKAWFVGAGFVLH